MGAGIRIIPRCSVIPNIVALIVSRCIRIGIVISYIIPDRVIIIPDGIVIIPDRVVIVPDRIVIVPDRIVIVPDGIIISNIVPYRIVAVINSCIIRSSDGIVTRIVSIHVISTRTMIRSDGIVSGSSVSFPCIGSVSVAVGISIT